MYLRIKQQTIRYRISKIEAEKLINDELLYDSLDLTENLRLSYSVASTKNHSNFSFDPDANLLNLKINKKELLKELEDRPSKKGIEVSETLSKSKILSVFLEIDIKKVKIKQ